MAKFDVKRATDHQVEDALAKAEIWFQVSPSAYHFASAKLTAKMAIAEYTLNQRGVSMYVENTDA